MELSSCKLGLRYEITRWEEAKDASHLADSCTDYILGMLRNLR
jgi:hypothetical protein